MKIFLAILMILFLNGKLMADDEEPPPDFTPSEFPNSSGYSHFDTPPVVPRDERKVAPDILPDTNDSNDDSSETFDDGREKNLNTKDLDNGEDQSQKDIQDKSEESDKQNNYDPDKANEVEEPTKKSLLVLPFPFSDDFANNMILASVSGATKNYKDSSEIILLREEIIQYGEKEGFSAKDINADIDAAANEVRIRVVNNLLSDGKTQEAARYLKDDEIKKMLDKERKMEDGKY